MNRITHWVKQPEPEDVTVAALLGRPFAVYILVLKIASPATSAQWAVAAPILKLLSRTPTLLLAPLGALVIAAFWWRIARPDRQAIRRGAIGAVVGALGALAFWGAVW